MEQKKAATSLNSTKDNGFPGTSQETASGLRGKSRGYTLVITEKPETARRIAFALDRANRPRKMCERGAPYYVAQQNEEIFVVPALGHLYTVAAEKSAKAAFPLLRFKWVPRYLAEKKAKQTRQWLETFTKLSGKASRFVDACDYDIEGSIIGYNILKYACKGKEKTAKRMKYSTLTDDELQKAYQSPMQHLDFALIEAGLARHEIDWLYGINLSRTLTAATKNYGKYKNLSIGRVQGPTLRFLATREEAIKNFVPIRYWQISAKIEIDGRVLEAEYENTRISDKTEAIHIKEACNAKNGVIQKIEERLTRLQPPVPFDLGTLQAEAYRLFKYTPKTTSEIAQHLYLDALISYPRTSNQKLPLTIDYRKVLQSLWNVADYRQLIDNLLTKPRLTPHEGRGQDFAHPAIYPTGRFPDRRLERQEINLCDLIVRRFMAVFADPALKRSTKAVIDVGSYHFHLTGEETVKEGWMRFYSPYVRPESISLPQMRELQSVNVRSIDVRAKSTEPPPRHDPRSLLRKMENAVIGTKATRAGIIETLYKRGYVKDQKMVLTDLGLELFYILEEHSPSIISPDLTREIENQMNSIRENCEKRGKMISENADKVKKIVQGLKDRENEIGERLTQAIRRGATKEETIGACPTCGEGTLFIVRSRSTCKRFLGCTNYFKGICKTSFPLPQNGIITRSRRNCKSCGWPTLRVQTKPKRFWTLCFNPQCSRKRIRKS